ncbi:hypothetical protein I3843_08G003500 [Carya illinoinensis]|nr:hypothetical protein I3843_08G003500 [Carya illinoinensis]
MILGYPEIVFSGKSDHEVALANSACKFICDFELLIKIMLEGDIQNANDKTTSRIPSRITVRSQLDAFDKAWSSYLYHFVLWKFKDAKSLDEDLVRTACQLELSMMQTCHLTLEGNNGALTHYMVAIQKQVTEEQKLLRTKVKHLSWNSGLERLERALSDMRSRFLEANDSGSSSAFPVPHLSSLCLPGTPEDSFACHL